MDSKKRFKKIIEKDKSQSDDFLGIKLPSDLKEKVVKLAKISNKSYSYVVKKILQDFFKGEI